MENGLESSAQLLSFRRLVVLSVVSLTVGQLLKSAAVSLRHRLRERRLVQEDYLGAVLRDERLGGYFALTGGRIFYHVT